MIITRTPLRISFAGGGTDLPEYYQKYGYGAVCSMAINKYVYIVAKDLPDLFSFKYKLAYSETELVNTLGDIQHPILKECVHNTPEILKSLDLTSMADIPAGTGMGSSSSFTVGSLNALHLLQGVMLSKEELANLACALEIDQLKSPIGKQDQYAAAYGGLNYIKFNADNSVEINPIILDPQRESLFLSHLRLYSLGTQDRSSNTILQGQKKEGSELDDLRNLAAACSWIFTHGTPKELGQLLNKAWELKKCLSPEISNCTVDTVYQLALNQGAYGGKLLGAGGTGFLLICADPETKLDLGLTQVPFFPDYSGSTSFCL